MAFTASSRATSCGVQTTTAPGERQQLRQRQRDVARARRHVDDQIIELAPLGVAQELRDRPVQHRPAPHDRFARRHQKAHAHHAQAVLHHRLQPIVLQMRPLVDAQQVRNAGAVDVGVHQADRRAAVLQSVRQRRGDRALADAPFAGADRDHALGREADLADFFRRPHVLDDAHVNIGAWAATSPRTCCSASARVSSHSRLDQVVSPASLRHAWPLMPMSPNLLHARHAAARFRDRRNPTALPGRHLE